VFDCEANRDCEVDYRPRIGILTQPVPDAKKKAFDYDSYILEINENFIRWSGSVPVAIPFDATPEQLDKILRQINGVLFTGGALDLVSKTSGAYHQYYKTAKQIFSYSLYMKDTKNMTWPILGIC